jgi:hypothetical protein
MPARLRIVTLVEASARSHIALAAQSIVIAAIRSIAKYAA